ncbi:MAG: nucleotidyltransferase domain-containing protein [Thermodesulfobacteriota bacterium]
MDRDAFLRRVKELLSEAFGDRLQGVVLYGSEARGEAQPDSDIDVIVLLRGPVNEVADTRNVIRTLYSLQPEVGFRPIDAYPVDVREYEAGLWAVYRNARQEGVRV